MQASFPIVIKVWAGTAPHEFRYLSRSLPSLFASDLPNSARVILIDDCSPDRRVQRFLRSFQECWTTVEIWENSQNLGPNKGQELNFPRVVEKYPDAPFYVMCDDDIIYHPGWLQRLIQVYEEVKQIGQRGVFTALNVKFRPSYSSLRLPTSEVLFKERQAALNWLLPRDVYEEVGPFRDTGVAFDTDYCNRLSALGIPVICLKPSYVQNIGYHGAYQFDDRFRAADYVGRRDLYLTARDFWFDFKKAVWAGIDRIPDGRWKQLGLNSYKRLRHWLGSI